MRVIPLRKHVSDPVSRQAVRSSWWHGCGLWRRHSAAVWPRPRPVCSNYMSETPAPRRHPPKPTVGEKHNFSHQKDSKVKLFKWFLLERNLKKTSKTLIEVLLFPSMSTRLWYSWVNLGWVLDALIASYHKQKQASNKTKISTYWKSKVGLMIINSPDSKSEVWVDDLRNILTQEIKISSLFLSV